MSKAIFQMSCHKSIAMKLLTYLIKYITLQELFQLFLHHIYHEIPRNVMLGCQLLPLKQQRKQFIQW